MIMHFSELIGHTSYFRESLLQITVVAARYFHGLYVNISQQNDTLPTS